jgi:hypothetical protein
MAYKILKGMEPGSSGFITDAKQMELDGVVAADPKNSVAATELVLSQGSTALTGTLASSGTTVTGTGTAFTTELADGDTIVVNDLAYTVDGDPASDSSLELTVTPSVAFAGDTGTKEDISGTYTTKSVEPFNITCYIEESVDVEQVHGDVVYVVDAG